MIRTSVLLAVIIISISVLGIATLGGAQSYRDKLKVAPGEIYSNMFRFLEKQEFSKIEGSIEFLLPLIQHIQDQYRIEIEHELRVAIKKREEASVRASLYRLMVLDIQDLFDQVSESAESHQDESRRALRSASIVYGVLSPIVMEKDVKSDMAIKGAFQTAYGTLKVFSLYSEENKVDVKALRTTLNLIRDELVKLFPEAVHH